MYYWRLKKHADYGKFGVLWYGLATWVRIERLPDHRIQCRERDGVTGSCPGQSWRCDSTVSDFDNVLESVGQAPCDSILFCTGAHAGPIGGCSWLGAVFYTTDLLCSILERRYMMWRFVYAAIIRGCCCQVEWIGGWRDEVWS